MCEPGIWLPEGAVLAYKLDLPWPTPSNNEIKGMHFTKYRKLRKNWRDAVWIALNGRLPDESLPLVFIEIDRYSQGIGLDWDNAYGGLKVLLDCLVESSSRNPDGLGLILDDNPACMPAPPLVKQLIAPRGGERTECRVYRIP